MNKARIALVCFGEINTAIERLNLKHDEALSYLQSLNYDVLDGGLVIDDAKYASADKAVSVLQQGGDFSSIVICVAGWVPTHAVIRVVDNFKHKPMLLWGLSGWKSGNKIITTAEQAGTTSLRSTLEALDFNFKFVYNMVGKPFPEKAITSFLDAAGAIHALRNERIVSVGYRDMLLYSTQYEATSVRRVFGVEVESMEMLEMVQLESEVEQKEVDTLVSYMKENWQMLKPAEDSLLETGARYALALGKKVESEGYKALTLNDVDGMKKLLNFPPAIVFILLSKIYGIDTTPENDVLGNLMQLIFQKITGKNAHYMEYYEFFEKSMLIGVPDYIPEFAVKGKVQILPAAFGLLTGSLLSVSKVQTGYVTCARLAYKKGKFVMHMYTGEAKDPPLWEEFGWDDPAPQLSSLEMFPDSCSVEEFAQKVCSQHVIVAYGDYSQELKDFCALLNIEVI
ncbi:MAG: L-arabinose isomerase family protein [Sphaerochaetaceae bacterium]